MDASLAHCRACMVLYPGCSSESISQPDESQICSSQWASGTAKIMLLCYHVYKVHMVFIAHFCTSATSAPHALPKPQLSVFSWLRNSKTILYILIVVQLCSVFKGEEICCYHNPSPQDQHYHLPTTLQNLQKWSNLQLFCHMWLSVRLGWSFQVTSNWLTSAVQWAKL